MGEPTIQPISRLDLRFEPRPWRFAEERRAEIEAHFAASQRTNPKLWNGRLLLMHEHTLADGVLRGAYLETDYASFHAWTRWGHPPTGVLDCFANAALLSSDGAMMLGVMASHTSNARKTYFPCGAPDPDDIVDGRVDLEFSVRRELKEETGLDPDELHFDSGWRATFVGGLIVQVKLVRSAEPADLLRARILANLAREREPELSDIRIVRGPNDFDASMPGYVTAFLTRLWDIRAVGPPLRPAGAIR